VEEASLDYAGGYFGPIRGDKSHTAFVKCLDIVGSLPPGITDDSARNNGVTQPPIQRTSQKGHDNDV
jgi:hypothetical protein